MSVPVNIKDGKGSNYVAQVTELGQLVVGPIAYSEPYTASLTSTNTAFTIAFPKIGCRFVVTDILLDADKNVSANTAGTVVLYEGEAVDEITEAKTILSIEMLKNTNRSITGLNLIVTEGVWLSMKTTDATINATVLGYYVNVPKEVEPSLGGGEAETPVASPLLDNLYAWYDLDEASGTRFDALGNWDLDQVGTITSEAGLITNSAGVPSSYYSSTQSTGLGFDGGGDWFLSMWIKFDAGGTFETFASTWGSAGSRSWFFSKDASDNIRVDTSNDGTNITLTTTHGSITPTNWNHVVFSYNDATGDMDVYINNSKSGTGHNDSLWTITNYFLIYGALATSSNAMTGNIDLTGLWNRVATADDVATLYNSGAGSQYPW